MVLRVTCIIRTRVLKQHPSPKWYLGNSSEDLTGDEAPQINRVLGSGTGPRWVKTLDQSVEVGQANVAVTNNLKILAT